MNIASTRKIGLLSAVCILSASALFANGDKTSRAVVYEEGFEGTTMGVIPAGWTEELGDAGMAWMHDYDESLAKGMAITMNLADSHPIDELIVFGIDERWLAASGKPL